MDQWVAFGYFFVIGGVATWAVGTRNLEFGVAAFLWFLGVAAGIYLLTGVVIPGGEALSRGLEGVAEHYGLLGVFASIGGGVTGILIARDEGAT